MSASPNHKSQPVPQITLAVLDKVHHLPAVGSWPASPHRFDSPSVWALNAALATRRPLLVRGEPGTGKSQLARAAAHVLQWPFLSRVVNARFEPEDLLFRFDAVARLAMAQIMPKADVDAALKHLEPRKFLLPEILWWAIDYESARDQFAQASRQCGETTCNYGENTGFPKTAESGVVVLIDEIDKADTEVPNSLLEALANNGFQAPFGGGPIRLGQGHPPLVVITTNEERELPAAFLRRCLVLQMDLPDDVKELRQRLFERARAHYSTEAIHDDVCHAAITQLLKDRHELKQRELPFPGQAELLDLLEALSRMCEGRDAQIAALENIRSFALSKNRI